MTLVPSKFVESVVLGYCYEIEYENVEKTFQYLDFREKCGYTRHIVDFYPLNQDNNEAEPFKSFCYYANESNEYFSNKCGEQEIAEVKNLLALLIGLIGQSR